MAMVYQWKPAARINLDAQVAGEHLEQVRVRNNGHLTPRAVVEEARDTASPLHPAFEWDNAVAAEAYREDQARYILRAITVVSDDPETGIAAPVRAFVSVAVDHETSYTHIVHAMSDVELRDQIVAKAWRELEDWRKRYADLEELAALFRAIDGK